MFSVFVFHCTRFFDTEDWHLKVPAAQQSEVWAITRGFLLWVWLMPLFFLIAGFATRYSLRHRSAGQYLVERVKRLLIPMYTVGMFIIVVPQAYFDRLTHGTITGTFWEWLPSFYRGLPGEVFAPPRVLDPIFLVPYTFSGHLWFIQLLFIIVVLTLPLAMGNLAKFLIVGVVSFPLILLIYEVCVRHIDFMRFLFGMTPVQKRPAAAPRPRLA